jgi:hypothetical protein
VVVTDKLSFAPDERKVLLESVMTVSIAITAAERPANHELAGA